ncbi:hypothetical protein F5Y04DRAFT_77930 [Hypomontagnella monticulosa]|nr:hypothetical protein F5Y04DRAFT_77930 [Hypomontagnella monticulosa]
MADSTNSPQTFPRFGELPLELREQIWFYCIPVRIIKLQDTSFRRHPREPLPYPQCMRPVLSPSPPLISRVCWESRDVALRHASVEHTLLWKTPIWVDRKRDTVIVDRSSSLDWLIRHESRIVSPRMRELINSSNIPIDITYDLIVHDGPRADERTFWVLDRLAGRETCSVVLHEVAIHLTHNDACASGLFGLFAEEATVHINIKDVKKVARLYRAFEKAIAPRGSKGNTGISTLRECLSDDLIGNEIYCLEQFAKTFWLQKNKAIDIDADPLDINFNDPCPPSFQRLLDQLPEFVFVIAVHLCEWNHEDAVCR